MSLAPPTFKQDGRDYAFYMRDYKGGTIKLLPTILYDRFFIYRTVKSWHLKKIKISCEKWYT